MSIVISGAHGRLATGVPALGYGAAAWRVRQMRGADSVLSLLVAEFPVAKPSYVSAASVASLSERCH